VKFSIIKISFVVFTALVSLSACKTKKGIGSKLPTTSEVKNDYSELFISINQQETNYSYLVCKGECEYNDGNNTFNFDIQLEMEKGKFIFIRATYLLGIEVAKMYITPDQIQIVNHLEKTNTVASYNYLKKFSSANLQFENLENLILGNALFNQNLGVTSIDSNVSQYILKTLIEGATQQCFYGKNKVAKLEANQLQNAAKNRSFEVKYNKYTVNGTNYYPSELAINIRAEKNLGCVMKLFNFAYEKKKDPQIRVPASYKTINY
jgi:phage anti-repressor protein